MPRTAGAQHFTMWKDAAILKTSMESSLRNAGRTVTWFDDNVAMLNVECGCHIGAGGCNALFPCIKAAPAQEGPGLGSETGYSDIHRWYGVYGIPFGM
jgi:hypothetical protein